MEFYIWLRTQLQKMCKLHSNVITPYKNNLLTYLNIRKKCPENKANFKHFFITQNTEAEERSFLEITMIQDHGTIYKTERLKYYQALCTV